MLGLKNCRDCIYCEDYFKGLCRCSVFDKYFDGDRANYCDRYDDIVMTESGDFYE